ncbi:hypothetical protein B0H13DRAFT_2557976 [Mycena leptocephala]|nr:hypothetical protein B0H13DRAFT_2557976 [Mycena leptocephala]
MAGLPTCHADSLIAAIRAKPPSFFHGAVRHLMLTSPGNLAEILPVCTSVESLWLLDLSEPLIQLVEFYPLKRLHTSCGPLLRLLPPTHRLFSRLTHLEIIRSPDDADVATHLSFHTVKLISICQRLLQSAPRLCVLVYLNPNAPRWEWRGYASQLAQDVQFVVTAIISSKTGTYSGTHGGADYWSRAEIFITRWQSGELDRAF